MNIQEFLQPTHILAEGPLSKAGIQICGRLSTWPIVWATCDMNDIWQGPGGGQQEGAGTRTSHTLVDPERSADIWILLGTIFGPIFNPTRG